MGRIRPHPLRDRDLFINFGPAFSANLRCDFEKALFGINLRFGRALPVRAS